MKIKMIILSVLLCGLIFSCSTNLPNIHIDNPYSTQLDIQIIEVNNTFHIDGTNISTNLIIYLEYDIDGVPQEIFDVIVPNETRELVSTRSSNISPYLYLHIKTITFY